MKQSKISRRSFLLGLGAVSAAAVLTACGGSSSASTAASGSAASGSSVVYRTLDQIKESGTINIGVFSDKNPFGYVDENGEYQGYDVYFARRLGEDLGVEINFVSTEAANRIEYLQTGKADVILANFTVTPERAEEVDFALPYMNVALGVISPDSNVITTLDNWNADDQMIVISGTTADLASELWHEVYKRYYPAKQLDTLVEELQSADAIEADIDNDVNYFLVVLGGKTIGYFAWKMENTALHLMHLYLRPEYRGKALGRDIVLSCERLARGEGKGRVWCTVHAKALPVQQFFKALRYRNLKPAEQENGTVPRDEVVFEHTLG